MALYTPTTALPAEELTRRLALVEQLHEQVGAVDIEELDVLDLWERLGLALRGELS